MLTFCINIYTLRYETVIEPRIFFTRKQYQSQNCATQCVWNYFRWMSWALGIALREENWIREKKASICMLQEDHCIDETNYLWRAEWGYEPVFTSYESNKAGVCFLFDNNFNFQFQRVYTDPARRFIICDIKVNEKPLTLANIYTPNEDNPSFFQDFLAHFVDFKCEDIIISGDFNLVMDQNSSKKS